MTRRLMPVLLGLLVLASTVRAEEDDPPAVQATVVSDMALDGLLEPFEAPGAAGIATVVVEAPDVGGGVRSVTVEFRVVVVDGALRVAATAQEPPGLGMGLSLMLAEEGTASAADAIAISYAPQDPRVSRFTVRGPRGVGREVYRVEAAAAVTLSSRWGVEVQVPLSDLGLSSPDTPLRLAVAARTREPRILAWMHPKAAFRGPSAWLRIEPPDGGWPLNQARGLPGDVLAKEDEVDRARLDAWDRFLGANAATVDDLVRDSGVEGGALEASDEQIQAVMYRALVQPLLDASASRPDLAMLHVVRGHVLRVLGIAGEANEAYGKALEVMPGLPEALFGRWLGLMGPASAAAPAGQASDYAARIRDAEDVPTTVDGGFAKDGMDFARGLLHHLQGDFDAARPLLDPLAKRYPFSQSIVFAAERNRSALMWQAREETYRASDVKKGGLPRVRIKTTKGDLVVELLAHDAPNTVDNFLWLAQHAFYDDAPVFTVPFFAVRVAEKRNPGYAIPTELPTADATWRPGARRDVRRRRPFRGTLVLLSAKQDAGAGPFAILSGTALHLQEEYVAFGRVLEGLDTLDALTGDDRILNIGIEDHGAGGDHRPITVEGTPAPEPTPR